MKKSLAELLDPRFHHRSIGELAKTLQFLLFTSRNFRDERSRWVSSGPTEILTGYGGCVNCYDHNWHSGRISSSCPQTNEVTTWKQNQDSLHSCILSSLCQDGEADLKWRKKHGIHLHMMLKFSMAYQNNDEEKAAWQELTALHGLKIPVSTLNSCHRNINVLAVPELIIGDAITIKCCVTSRSEIRSGPAFSRWDACYLTRQPQPKWNCHRETFSQFINRAVTFYRTIKPELEKEP